MSHRLVAAGMDVGVVVGTAADTANASADAVADAGANVAADAAAADEATAGAGVEDAAAAAADVEDDDDDDEPPSTRHHPDLLRQVLLLVAAHGYTREAAAATLAVRDLHHDDELLARTALVATRAGGETLLMRAVRRGDAARAGELLRACPTRASRAALLAAADATGATPLTRAATGALVRELLRAGATAPATPGVGVRDDGLAWAVSAGRLVLVEALLEALPRWRAAPRGSTPWTTRAARCCTARASAPSRSCCWTRAQSPQTGWTWTTGTPWTSWTRRLVTRLDQTLVSLTTR